MTHIINPSHRYVATICDLVSPVINLKIRSNKSMAKPKSTSAVPLSFWTFSLSVL